MILLFIESKEGGFSQNGNYLWVGKSLYFRCPLIPVLWQVYSYTESVYHVLYSPSFFGFGVLALQLIGGCLERERLRTIQPEKKSDQLVISVRVCYGIVDAMCSLFWPQLYLFMYCWILLNNILFGLPWWLNDKESACNAGDLIPGLERPLEEKMVTHSSILAWKISRTEERAWQATVFIGSEGVGYHWAHTCIIS